MWGTIAGRDTRLSVWQFRQLVDAIRNLGETAGAAWVGDLDWAHWRASAETLAPDHPTVARDYGQEVAGLEPAGPMRDLAEVRAQHQAVMDQMVTAIRRRGYSIRTVQGLLGHADVSTTMIYTHVLNRGGKGVRSPLDRLL
jgi:hypothetical protein